MMIRSMKDNEVYLVFQLIQETIDCSYSDIYPDQAVEFFKAFHSETKIRNRARLGDVLLFEQDGTILATGALVKNKIEGVFVKPDFHGQGIGRNIMGELEKLASSHGFASRKMTISIIIPISPNTLVMVNLPSPTRPASKHFP